MTLEELRKAALVAFGGQCEIQEVKRDRKAVVWCRKEFVAAERHRRTFHKSITFAADNIPEDAIAKMEKAFAL